MEAGWREKMKKCTQNAEKTIVIMKYAVACEDKNGLKPECKLHDQFKKNKHADKLEGLWQRDTKMVRGLEHEM